MPTELFIQARVFVLLSNFDGAEIINELIGAWTCCNNKPRLKKQI
jgi:hypothetical protein